MILLIDNHDSFTYNIVELLRNITSIPVHVKKSTTLECGEAEPYTHLIFSPGPGLPEDFPIMQQILTRYDASKPILGICLGHQAICQYYGGSLLNLPQVKHGIETQIICNPNSVLFRGIQTLQVGRYHSWVADLLPDILQVTATTPDRLIMGVEHTSKRVYGVQFHPESYITKQGDEILRNFLNT